MEIIMKKIEEIKPYSNNPRKNKEAVKIVKKSIKEFGFKVPIILDKNDEIIAGHTRLEASKELKLKEVPVIYAKDLTPEQVKAFRIMDNKSQEYSKWNNKLLKEELECLKDIDFDLSLTGFNEAELSRFFDGEEEEELKEFTPRYDIKHGDVWELGDHLLMCGDSTEEGTFKKITKNGKYKLCITSPPYNMNAGMYNKEYTDNMQSQQYIDFNLQVIKLVERFLEGYVFWNLSYNKNSRWEYIEIFHRIIHETELKFLENIIWDKGHGMPVNSRDSLTREYEQILVVGNGETIQKELDYCFLGSNKDKVYFNKKGFKALTNYWRINTFNIQTSENRAAFPVELPKKAIILMTDPGDNVLDPFGGTGTTLIACEQTGRKAHLIELSPNYCSYIIERWEKLTGKKAEKIK